MVVQTFIVYTVEETKKYKRENDSKNRHFLFSGVDPIKEI